MIAVFIDGANLYATCRALNIEIDYKLLKNNWNKARLYYYTAILPDRQHSTIQPLLDWMDYNGITVVTKLAKEWTDPLTGRKKVKGNMDIEMAVDAIGAAAFAEEVWLFTGDGDFTYLVNKLKSLGTRVVVVSTIQTQPVMIADELRRSADEFIELKDLNDRLNDPKEKSKWA